MKNFAVIIIVSFISGLGGAYLYDNYIDTNSEYSETAPLQIKSPVYQDSPRVLEPSATRVELNSNDTPYFPEDFIDASIRATASVVYIKNISARTYGYSFFDWYFGESGRSIETVSSGSGVILTPDGYIVTNHHVIKGADKIVVEYNKNQFTARLIGTDPSSDLAVIKIDGSDLPAIRTGNSRGLKVGEWVLAIGNPFNLTSTVTAGIVSAKGRELNILESKFPIESFIQTDAAINPGNSGGALVNRKGDLIGINTAILSRTGSYAGYGFAVPVDIVKKVVHDIIEYGEVQKAFIGADVIDLTSEIARNLDIKIDLNKINGVVINYIQDDGAADNAGLKEGDILLQIDENLINSRSDFEEVISYHSPGDIISVKFIRNQKMVEKRITLTNREGTIEILKREIFSSEYLGADLESVSKVERDLMGIDYGVKILKVYDRGLMSNLGLEEGFIVTDINYTRIRAPKQLVEALSDYRGRVTIAGIDASGRKGYYTFYLR